jgi:hypothetical protein
VRSVVDFIEGEVADLPAQLPRLPRPAPIYEALQPTSRNSKEIRMSLPDVVLCHPVRTAIGTFNGTLKNTPATELGAAVVRETLRRAALDPRASAAW